MKIDDFNIAEAIPNLIETSAAISVACHCFEQYMDYRQYRHLKQNHPLPASIADKIDPEERTKARMYSLECLRFSFFQGNILATISIASLLYRVHIKQWNYITTLTDNFLLQSTFYFLFDSFVSTLIALPFSYYSKFVIEEKWGFNKTTKALFFTDTLKGIFLEIVIDIPLSLLITFIITRLGESSWFPIFLVLISFQVFFTFFYFELIAPLFNKFTPLEDGKLKTRIAEELVGFPKDKIFVLDGSKRSSKGNAYVGGLFSKKRIVLYDNLFNQLSGDDEIMSVLAHEYGHYKHKHVPKLLITNTIMMLIVIRLSAYLMFRPAVYEALGFDTTKNVPYLIVISILLSLFKPIFAIISFGSHAVSRFYERQADTYAVKNLGYGCLSNALVNLHTKNLSSMFPDKLWSAYRYDHPTLAERIELIEQVKNENKIE